VRKLLNVLYITNPDAYLARDGENVVVRIDDEIKFRVPVHNLESIVCFGYPGASPALLGLCAERGIAVSFVTEHGKFLARVTGRVSGNVLLRRRQYRIADDAGELLKIAHNFIFGKIFNCRCVLQRFLRDHGQAEDTTAIEDKLNLLSFNLQDLENIHYIDELRGLKGDAARNYYVVFDWLILEQKEVFQFSGRSRRPPLDPMNAVLSFLYTLLAHDCAAALETVGLDPQVGFLHCERPGRPSLALDMMEELRPYLVDRLALSLINNRQLSSKGFEVKESGGVLMDEETRKTVITAWQKRKQEEITHPFLKEKISAGLIPYAQSLLLARHLRGDLDAYPPFLMK
jgi:CRISPR-associated protein Cas1